MPRFGILLLALIALPLLAETPVAPPRIGTSSNAKYVFDPDVAAGPQSYLVAWAEGLAAPYATAIDIRLYGSDLSPRQRTSVRISNQGSTPRAVWNGTDYLLAWGIAISRFNSFPTPAIETVHVREDGSIVPNSQRTFFPQVNAVRINGMAFNGSRYAFVAAGQLAITDGEGALVSARGISGIIDVAAHGDGFRVLAAADGNVTAIDVDAGGSETGRQVIATTTSGPVTGRIATDHDQTAVVWSDVTGMFGVELETGVRYTFFPDAETPRSLTRLANGDWLAAWDNRILPNTGCWATFSGGRMTLECGPTGKSDHTSPFAVGNMIVFVDHGTDFDRLIGGSRSGPFFVITEVAAEQEQPAAAETHIAWSESDPSERLLRLRLDDVIVAPSDQPQRQARLVAAGNQLLLVWTEGTEIRAVRVDGSGQILPPVLDLGSGQNPAVASNGTDWLIAWMQTVPPVSDQRTQIAATTVTAAGNVLSPGGTIIVPDPNSTQRSPAVSWTGAGYLVVYNLSTPVTPREGRNLEVAQLIDAGANRIAQEVYLAIDPTATMGAPSVACNGSVCPVVWGEAADGLHFLLRGALMTSTGLQAADARDLIPGAAGASLALRSDGNFDLFLVNHIVLTPALDVISTETLPVSGVFTRLPGGTLRAVYARYTAPEEMYGSVSRVFYEDLPPPRVRAARH